MNNQNNTQPADALDTTETTDQKCLDPNCREGLTWITNLDGQPERRPCGCTPPAVDAGVSDLTFDAIPREVITIAFQSRDEAETVYPEKPTPPAERPTLTAEENNAIRFNDAIAGVTSERPTPHPSGAWSRSDYAKAYDELERQLAEAIEELESNGLVLQKLQNERDEAREQRDRLSEAISHCVDRIEGLEEFIDGQRFSRPSVSGALTFAKSALKGSTNEPR